MRSNKSTNQDEDPGKVWILGPLQIKDPHYKVTVALVGLIAAAILFLIHAQTDRNLIDRIMAPLPTLAGFSSTIQLKETEGDVPLWRRADEAVRLATKGDFSDLVFGWLEGEPLAQEGFALIYYSDQRLAHLKITCILQKEKSGLATVLVKSEIKRLIDRRKVENMITNNQRNEVVEEIRQARKQALAGLAQAP